MMRSGPHGEQRTRKKDWKMLDRLDVPSSGSAPDSEDETSQDTQKKKRKEITCGTCGSLLATKSSEMEVAGRHTHIFMNPTATTFHVGCFHPVPGCTIEGETTDDYSWFPPYAWCYAHCTSCACHLGWFFSLPDHSFHFFCLILERLQETDGEQD